MTYPSKLLNRQPIDIGRSEVTELFTFVKNSTKKDAVFVFPKPRVLALYGERRASKYNTNNVDMLWEYSQRIGASYYILPLEGSGLFQFKVNQKLISRKGFQMVFSNKLFKVFKVPVN